MYIYLITKDKDLNSCKDITISSSLCFLSDSDDFKSAEVLHKKIFTYKKPVKPKYEMSQAIV